MTTTNARPAVLAWGIFCLIAGGSEVYITGPTRTSDRRPTSRGTSYTFMKWLGLGVSRGLHAGTLSSQGTGTHGGATGYTYPRTTIMRTGATTDPGWYDSIDGRRPDFVTGSFGVPVGRRAVCVQHMVDAAQMLPRAGSRLQFLRSTSPQFCNYILVIASPLLRDLLCCTDAVANASRLRSCAY